MMNHGGATTVKEEKNCVSVLLFWDHRDFVKKGGRKGDIPVALGYTLGFIKECVENTHEKVFESQSTLEGKHARYDVVFLTEQQARRFNTNVTTFKKLPEKVRMKSFLYNEVELDYKQEPVLTETDVLQIIKTDQLKDIFRHFLTCSVVVKYDKIFFKFNTLADVNLFLYDKCRNSDKRVLGMFRKNQEQLCLLSDSDEMYCLRVQYEEKKVDVRSWDQWGKKFGFVSEHLNDHVRLKFKTKLDLYIFFASLEAKTCHAVEISQSHIVNPQEQLEREEKAMREKLQAVETELRLARVELAKKENIFQNQRRLIAELQTEYKFNLDRKNKMKIIV